MALNASTASAPSDASATTCRSGFVVDDVGDAGPQQRVVVDDQHPRRGHAGLRLASRRPHWATSPGLGIENDGGSQASTTSVPRAAP